MTNKPGAVAFPSKIGVFWNSEPWPIADAQSMVREIEALGYGSLFMPEGSGKDVMIQSAAFLGATESLVVGTGIANVHIRVPTAAESGARILTALYPGRFVLGLGVSHAPFVEGSLGKAYSKPLSMMRTYLDRMNAVPTELEPGSRPTRLLAALGPKMIELSGELADGAHPYLVLPEQTRHTRAILGDDPWIVTEQAIAIGGSDADQLRRARSHVDPYSRLENYRKSWLRQGFDDTDLANGGSERLIRALVGMGSAEDAAASVTAHLDAGADHVVVQVAVDAPADDPLPDLRALAAVLDL